jgi:cell division protease FtsH
MAISTANVNDRSHHPENGFTENGFTDIIPWVGKSTIYSDFMRDLRDDKISDMVVFPDRSMVKFHGKDGSTGNCRLPTSTMDWTHIVEDTDVKITYDFEDTGLNITSQPLPLLVTILVGGLLLRNVVATSTSTAITNRREGTDPKTGGFLGLLGFPKSPLFGSPPDQFALTVDTSVSFRDVAGMDEARGELEELVDFLRTPERYAMAGASIPKGCLLEGPPGTGKTLLAKAIAGEAGVPFISTTASEFIELFVGVGAARVRELFETARRNSPCIIFIDELDTIGKARTSTSSYRGGANDEREQTLNQLLTEMDGFKDNMGVVVLAATNRMDVLDPALLRPGRFDRKIKMTLPSKDEREKILRVHSRGKRLGKSVDLAGMAAKTVGFNGAELMTLMNEATIHSVRCRRPTIEAVDLEDAFDKITVGLPRNVSRSHNALRTVAYHEAGHTVVALTLEGFDQISKVSILPRGDTDGIVQFVPIEDYTSGGMFSKDYLFKKIVVGLAGRVAEELVFGGEWVTTGAVEDLNITTTIAYNMIEKYGFSESVGLRYMKGVEKDRLSQHLRSGVDDEISGLLWKAKETAQCILTNKRPALDRVATALMSKYTLEGKELLSLLYAH